MRTVPSSVRISDGTATLAANFSWVFVGNVIYTLCQWGILVVIARVCSVKMLGEFTLGLALAAPVFMLTNLALRAVQVTDAKDKAVFAQYLGLRVCTTLLACFFVICIDILWLRFTAATLVVGLVMAAKAVESVSDIYFAHLQRHELMDRVARSMIAKGTLSLLAVLIILTLTRQVAWAALALVVVWACILMFYDIKAPEYVKRMRPHVGESATKPSFNVQKLWRLAWASLPVGVVMSLSSLNVNLPRYVIQSELGSRELGIFAALAYLMTASTTVVSALGQAASPRLAAYFADHDLIRFKRLTGQLVLLGIVIGLADICVGAFAGYQILRLVYGPAYAAFSKTFVWVMLASGIADVASFLGYATTATRSFRPQVPVSLLTCLCTGASAVLLVPMIGLDGAGISLCLGSALQASGYAVLLKRAVTAQ